MSEWRADLHCHSTCSDGILSPVQIVDLAKEIRLSGLCITDHDTIDAYPSIIEYAANAGIEMISGVEFSCVHKNKNVHVLGYSFSTKNEEIKVFCGRHQARRTKRYMAILERLANARMPISEEDIKKQARGGASIGRPHIALAMMEKGYVLSVEEAFKKYLGDGMPFYVKGEAFPVQETIDVIHQAGGLAIIAHPHLIKEQSTVHHLLALNFDGLEAYYSRFDKMSDLRWVELAESKKWLITGGSDFHGSVKPQIQLGCSWVEWEIFQLLKQKYVEAERSFSDG
jgi:3',5'-nucleoside bisphosphate phosphatase